MEIINQIKQKAKENPKRIVFPESNDDRILKAVCEIVQGGFAKPLLLGKPDEVNSKLSELGLNSGGIEIIDPINFGRFNDYVNEFTNLRQGRGMTPEKSAEMMKDVNYFGTMMVHMGDADGLVSGATHSTGDTIRPALQIIKTKEAFHKASSFFLMIMEDRLLIFADAAIEINPDAKDLAELAIDTTETAKKFGIDPRIAMLSFSTKGSAKHPLVDKVVEATKIVQGKRPDLKIDGELQVDAALVPEICRQKAHDCKLDGDANILIFPDLQAANIAYKLVERLAKAKAVGPILQGLNKPVNDLSRGCSVEDIVDVTVITVVEAQDQG